MFRIIYFLSRKIRGVNKILRLFYGCDIPYSAKIAKSVYFNHHALGVVIHPNTMIDDNVHVEHHVLLGQRVGGVVDAPHIERNCVIGAYAILLGGITVGEGSVVGAGSIVLHDIPPHSIYYNERVEMIKNNNKPLGEY